MKVISTDQRLITTLPRNLVSTRLRYASIFSINTLPTLTISSPPSQLLSQVFNFDSSFPHYITPFSLLLYLLLWLATPLCLCYSLHCWLVPPLLNLRHHRPLRLRLRRPWPLHRSLLSLHHLRFLRSLSHRWRLLLLRLRAVPLLHRLQLALHHLPLRLPLIRQLSLPLRSPLLHPKHHHQMKTAPL